MANKFPCLWDNKGTLILNLILTLLDIFRVSVRQLTHTEVIECRANTFLLFVVRWEIRGKIWLRELQTAWREDRSKHDDCLQDWKESTVIVGRYRRQTAPSHFTVIPFDISTIHRNVRGILEKGPVQARSTEICESMQLFGMLQIDAKTQTKTFADRDDQCVCC